MHKSQLRTPSRSFAPHVQGFHIWSAISHRRGSSYLCFTTCFAHKLYRKWDYFYWTTACLIDMIAFVVSFLVGPTTHGVYRQHTLKRYYRTRTSGILSSFHLCGAVSREGHCRCGSACLLELSSAGASAVVEPRNVALRRAVSWRGLQPTEAMSKNNRFNCRYHALWPQK